MSFRRFGCLLDTRILGVAACLWLVGSVSVARAQEDEEDPMLLEASEQFEGQVTQVTRVAELSIAYSGKLVHLRLVDLQIPKKGDPIRQQGQQRMEQLLEHQTVGIRLEDPDAKTDRLVRGDVYLQKRDVRLDLLQDGLAAYCPARAPDPALARQQEQARQQKAGIWARYATVETACSDLAK